MLRGLVAWKKARAGAAAPLGVSRARGAHVQRRNAAQYLRAADSAIKSWEQGGGSSAAAACFHLRLFKQQCSLLLGTLVRQSDSAGLQAACREHLSTPALYAGVLGACAWELQQGIEPLCHYQRPRLRRNPRK